jgi:two-component system sensor histidine kinase MtrB
LERIVSNLVDNAIKFTTEGGVTLAAAVQAEGSAGPAGAGAGAGVGGEREEGGGGTVVVRVRDSGAGIPESGVPFLFDEFYQVDNHERDRNKGFGIGLAICRSLARQLGGDVRLADTGDGGSCFEIVLPSGAGAAGAGGGDSGADGDGADDDGDGTVRAGRGGRPHGATRDREHPAAAGLCGV